MSLSEDKGQARKLRQSMESWKHIIVRANSVLLWEQAWHPSAILGSSTVAFMLLWLIDPTMLSILAFLGLVITLCDFVVPLVASSVFKDDITPAQQARFDEICSNIVLYKTKAELLFISYYKLRTTNPKLYFVITMAALSVLCWIGSTFNNLFLSYLAISSLLLLPGLDRNGMLDRSNNFVSRVFTDLVENAKTKVVKKKQ